MHLRDGKEFVIAVDFDGTLCFPIVYPGISDKRRGVVNFAKWRKRKGNTLIFHTCRIGKELEEAILACKSWGLEFDYVNENAPWRIKEFGGDCRKISADLYLEDKAIHPDIINFIFEEAEIA